jgi:hypothetical protein
MDPSFFRLAEGTGGHLLLLAPGEVGDSAALLTALGDHPQTIFRLAGLMNPGPHEFQIPIDSTVESVVFSLSVQCLETAEVLTPSGATAAGPDVKDLTNFRAIRMVTVASPQPGTWTVRISGRGIAGVVVQARSGIGLTQVEFAANRTSRFGPRPLAAVPNSVRLAVTGHPDDVAVSVVNGAFHEVARVVITAATDDEERRLVTGAFTPGRDPFRVMVTGRDARGFPFQRVAAQLVTPETR